MKRIPPLEFSYNSFIALFFIFCFTGCTPNHAPKIPTLSPAPKMSSSSSSFMTFHNVPHFEVAGEYIWLFYEHYMAIIKDANSLRIIHYRDFLPDTCPPKVKKRTVRGHGPRLASGNPINPRWSGCVPRLPLTKGSGLSFLLYPHPRRIWVLDDRIAISLGMARDSFAETTEYFFKHDGTFIESKNQTKGWELRSPTSSGLQWHLETTKGSAQGGLKMSVGDERFSAYRLHTHAAWIFLTQKGPNGDLLKVYDRDKGTLHAEYKSDEYYGVTLRDQGDGVYLFKRKHNKMRPYVWYGNTGFIKLANEDPNLHCYAFRGKRKCIPKSFKHVRDVVETESLRAMYTWDRKMHLEFLP